MIAPIVVLLLCFTSSVVASENRNLTELPPWVKNCPSDFAVGKYMKDNSVKHHDHLFHKIYQKVVMNDISPASDGESLDAVEHFFWNVKKGVVIELGAIDGTPVSGSMTYWMERILQWKRILIEANPGNIVRSLEENTGAFIVNAAICDSTKPLHYRTGSSTSGIVEFMAPDFLRVFHKDLYEAGSPPGDVSSIKDFSRFERITEIGCASITDILKAAKVNHVNYFILDVEVTVTVLFDIISFFCWTGCRVGCFTLS
jgi:hypothetical protein